MNVSIIPRRTMTTATLVAVVSLSACQSHSLLPSPTAYRSPYESVHQFMEGVFAAERDIQVSKQHRVRAAIVPHHLVSPAAVAAGIRALEPWTYERVVLLSPDHFGRCKTILCTTHGTFETLFGTVQTSKEGVRSLLSSPIAAHSPALFEHEHGIFSILPFIAKYLPKTEIVPIVLSQEFAWKSHPEEILAALESLLDEKTALIISTDFSHYLPVAKADEMDRQTMLTFLSKDLKGIAALKNPEQDDCPNCLWALASLADKHHFFNPSILLHTNSARLLNDLSTKETTSHFAIALYENSALTPADPAFAGDVTVTRGNARKLSENVAAFWSGTGARIVNLEGPLEVDCPPSDTMFTFCNPLSRFQKIASLATGWTTHNNHMLDQLIVGLDRTHQLLRQQNEIAISDEMVSHAGIKLISFTTFHNPVIHQQYFDFAASRTKVFNALRSTSDTDFVVVFLHDGIEYDPLSTQASIRLYRQLIDAGADAVIAAHTHVPGDMEIYNEKPIFRGLGNFIFDQYDEIPNSTKKMVRLKKDGDAIRFETVTSR